MNKVFKFIFILLYSMMDVFLILEFLDLSGLTLTGKMAGCIYIIWSLICFSASWWSPSIYLWGRRVRKTILEEDIILNPILEELNQRSKIFPGPELLLLESTEPDVFAIGRKTIVLSRGLFALLTIEEIKAVLAHEYGHLRDKDGFLSCALSLAAYPFLQLYIQLVKIRFKLKKILVFLAAMGSRRTSSFILLMILVILICRILWNQVFILIVLFLFFRLYPYFNKLSNFIWCYFSRVTEYRQDEFAQTLGYGPSLKNALLKICPLNEDVPIERIAVIHQSHPIMADRVRRIEWLEGLRTSL